jgi:Rps23 Pro-64 3,4-dihydroxylase Tpa1-like proline 4-hydroxylase
VHEEIIDNPVRRSDGCAIDGTKCYNSEKEKLKTAYDNEMKFGPATAALFSYLKSSTFITFLEHLTNIQDLIPDPHYQGSGIHQTLPGGKLDVHADFNRYTRYDMHRRVNVFIYLNPHWNESYGGHLELWSRDLKSCHQRILPSLGRLTIFSSTDFSYHGHSTPLACPPNRSRRYFRIKFIFLIIFF